MKVTDTAIINERKRFASKYRNYSNNRLYYIDETGINLHSRRNFGYSPVNTVVNTLVPPRKRNVSVLCLISNEKIIYSKIVEGPFNSNLLVDFFRECNQNSIVFDNKIVLMDNVRFHKTVEVRNFLNQAGIEFDFVPPYSPQLNPIEEVFSVLKSRYYNLRPFAVDNTSIIRYINDVITGMNNSDLNINSFYNHMRDYLDKAFNGEFL